MVIFNGEENFAQYLQLLTVLALIVMLLLTGWIVVQDFRRDTIASVFNDPLEELHISVANDRSAMLAGHCGGKNKR